jgi:hypothetical protein
LLGRTAGAGRTAVAGRVVPAAAGAGAAAPGRRRVRLVGLVIAQGVVEPGFVEPRRVEGVAPPPVRQRQQRRLPDVLGGHHVATVPRRVRHGRPSRHQVRPKAVDLEGRAHPSDPGQLAVRHRDGRQQPLRPADPAGQLRIGRCPGLGEPVRVRLVRQPPAHHLGSGRRLPGPGHLNRQPEPVE